MSWSISKVYSFFNLGARWGGWLSSRPGCLPPRISLYPSYEKLGNNTPMFDSQLQASGVINAATLASGVFNTATLASGT